MNDADEHTTLLRTESQNESEVIAKSKVGVQDCSVSLDDTLWYAKTPTRKGKKESEKVPFAITSTQWLKRKAHEEEMKKQKLLEKEERKKLRLEKQNEKKKAKDNKPKRISKKNATASVCLKISEIATAQLRTSEKLPEETSNKENEMVKADKIEINEDSILKGLALNDNHNSKSNDIEENLEYRKKTCQESDESTKENFGHCEEKHHNDTFEENYENEPHQSSIKINRVKKWLFSNECNEVAFTKQQSKMQLMCTCLSCLMH
ncbi:hypothetical protein FQR65_LT17323 [Abscondita terminalis]|nr:hypothetical protein FQR65_LT17323 [Abscondita terminalis]